jgi:excinuclease ABC subunit A
MSATDESPTEMRAIDIVIEGARSHNLKSANCRIPLGSLTVVTGVSGSGKSSLAFDTLYAEGQRRYVTSLSTYARQFLERLPRPEVEHISNLPPAIAIERRNRVTNARSTVGTASEIADHLRLLFAKIGQTRCPECDQTVEQGTVGQVSKQIVDRFEGERLQLCAPLVRRSGEKTTALRDRLVREGFGRVLTAAGEVADVADLTAKQLDAVRGSGHLLIDRLVPKRDASQSRLAEAVASAFARGEGRCIVVAPDATQNFYEGFACDGCGRRFSQPRPVLFSFNSSLGACETCEGFGRVAAVDWERVVPEPQKSLEQGAIAPFASRSGNRYQLGLLTACRTQRVAVDVPFEQLGPDQRQWIFEGDGDQWHGVRRFFDRLERKRYKVQNRVMLARYRRYDPCPECDGARLCRDALCVRIRDMDIAQVCELTLAALEEWLSGLELDVSQMGLAGRVLDELRARTATALAVGLGYVTLARPMRTLAGGEAQRIQLASALGGTLTASLYVLDEPTAGLHASDAIRLVAVLESIRDHGNTVVVVEHAPEVLRAADHVIDLGPGAGRHGGEVVFEGGVDAIAADDRSLTGRALRGEYQMARSAEPRTPSGMLRVVGATQNNLRGLSVDLPLGQLVAVTDLSGSGKSSLIRSVLVGNLRREPDRGACERIVGGDQIESIVVVDPHPPARSTRSNPATLSKAFDGIRQQFASTREAKALGATPGWFSFNVPGGRCDGCDGVGEVVVDMYFLDDVRMPCEQCNGRRYRKEALEVRVSNLSIADVLDLTVDEALDVFGADPKIAERLRSLTGVGLGYIALGQPLSTLSSGETQRLRLAQALAQGGAGTLFVLDEPTTGLHAADIDILIGCFDRVLDAGGSVVVVEHNLAVIARADHVIDLGPGAGPAGGEVVATGTPAQIAAHPHSHTGAALRAAGSEIALG